MGTQENKVKQFIDKWMKEWFPDAFRYSPPGTAYFGRNGMPDRMWIIRASEHSSIIVGIEAKSENGAPTELQLKTLSRMAKQGAVVAVVVGKDLDHLRRIRDEVYKRIKNSTGDI